MSPFYLLYGRNLQLPTALDFQLPAQRFPTIETGYGRELAKELEQARAIPKQNIEKKQQEQKKHCDRKTKDVKLKVGDLVMLKTEPRFRLDRSYKGPFEIKSLTSTNAVIQLKDDTNGMCRVREMLHSAPWTGHSGKLRKRRQIRCKVNMDAQAASQDNSGVTNTSADTSEQRNDVKFSRR